MESTTRSEAYEEAIETLPELSAEPVSGSARKAAQASVSSALVSSAGDECAECGANLAADQRYCVECGNRRGEARIPFMDGMLRPAPEAAAPPRRSRRVRMTANGTLIAGVGTLLLAMGIGVLIGRAGHDSGASKSAGAQVITVQGGGGTASTANAGAGGVTGSAVGSGSGGSKKAAKNDSGSSKSKQTELNRSVQKKGESTPPSAVKIGSPGHGKGYKNGKFTGDFFGP